MQHTPGPWAFCNDTLCQANGKYLHLGKWTESCGLGKAAEANKRLIEAAPALLDALRVIAENGPVGPNDDPERHSQHRKYLRALNLARAAIAAAEGQA